MGHYDVALVCQNGHVATGLASRSSLHNKFCDKCGAPTITTCPSCQTNIRGEYYSEDVFILGDSGYVVPSFCYQCGRAFPWTQRRLDAARALADEVFGLNPEEREQLKRSLDDLVSDTPNTPVAVHRFKRLMVKAGKATADTFYKVLVDVMSEAAKKAIWPAA